MYYITVKDFLFGSQTEQVTFAQLKAIIDSIENGEDVVVNGVTIEHANIEAVRFVTPKFNHLNS